MDSFDFKRNSASQSPKCRGHMCLLASPPWAPATPSSSLDGWMRAAQQPGGELLGASSGKLNDELCSAPYLPVVQVTGTLRLVVLRPCSPPGLQDHQNPGCNCGTNIRPESQDMGFRTGSSHSEPCFHLSSLYVTCKICKIAIIIFVLSTFYLRGPMWERKKRSWGEDLETDNWKEKLRDGQGKRERERKMSQLCRHHPSCKHPVGWKDTPPCLYSKTTFSEK